MYRIQEKKLHLNGMIPPIQRVLMMLFLSLNILVGCSQVTTDTLPAPVVSDVRVLTVSQYLHDIDAAREVLKATQAMQGVNPQRSYNASQAVALSFNHSVMGCWPQKPSKTDNTDHGCLEKLGYPK
jgi:hypothetical protein